MEWTEGSPEGFAVSSWQELVQKNQRPSNSEVLPLDKDSQVPPVLIFCPTASGGFDLVKYTSEVSFLFSLSPWPSAFPDEASSVN